MWMRRNAAEALGTIGPAAVSTAPTLARAMGDEEELVRRNAVFSLSKMAPPDDELVPPVARALADPNRYTRYCCQHCFAQDRHCASSPCFD